MVKRGDIYFADLSPVVGSEQGGIRPVLVIQNNLGNHFSPTIIVAAVTAKMAKPKLPTHIGINSGETGIERDSVILLEQIRTIDKARLKEKVCHLGIEVMTDVDRALGISVGILEAEEAVDTYQI
ncbi:type II toxin-antitoxin system PemK/MazF family toxin [Enterococcus sp. BWR-S5]|uniref:type II toxin-antitoxin system PemK/MazF family toxin n=1 Tax=Enterococcus sp. BWR-S5 TaxID=2787714 RepID=UPI0019210F9B|nr:type II toxin-antitoxin system PemK/MazF family toxin [Enterococcus sp. BWR-S5]MBL1223567.1 type II toxin-antitoxin system PemK/MazF family toxin [Enterococcus sp. BWR-S5]